MLWHTRHVFTNHSTHSAV